MRAGVRVCVQIIFLCVTSLLHREVLGIDAAEAARLESYLSEETLAILRKVPRGLPKDDPRVVQAKAEALEVAEERYVLDDDSLWFKNRHIGEAMLKGLLIGLYLDACYLFRQARAAAATPLALH